MGDTEEVYDVSFVPVPSTFRGMYNSREYYVQVVKKKRKFTHMHRISSGKPEKKEKQPRNELLYTETIVKTPINEVLYFSNTQARFTQGLAFTNSNAICLYSHYS